MTFTAPELPEGSVAVIETGIAGLEMIGRTATSSFLIGGHRTRATGSNAIELLQASLATCTCTTVGIFADRQRLPLERLSVVVSCVQSRSGERDRLYRTITLDGDLTQEQRDQLLVISVICPIS